jgi:hypothetical protein
MATKYGIRNYSRSGNTVTFTVVALNANGTIDTSYTGQVTFGSTNFTGGLGPYTFTAADQGARVFTTTISNPNNRASLGAFFPQSDSGATLVVGGPTGENLAAGLTGESLFVGGTGNDNYTTNGSDDLFRFELGGNDTGNGGGGNDGFYFGAAYTSADTVNGGAGTLDQIGLQGNYSGATTLGSMLETELVVLLPGSDTRFGDTAGNFYDYNLVANASTIVSNNRLTIQANTLRAGEDVTFNGSASAIDILVYGGLGVDNLTGGSGNDGFLFGQGRFGAGDVVNGGAGTQDQIGFQGNFTAGNNISFGANQLTGIEAIVLLSASDNRFGYFGGTVSYTVVMDDGNVIAGQRMLVSANTLQAGERLFLIGTAETNGSFLVYSGAGNDAFEGGALADEIWAGAGADILYGYAGADILRGGAGNDQFRYAWMTDSTASERDQIRDFAAGDKIFLLDLVANTGGTEFTFIGLSAPNGPRQVQVQQTGDAATVNIFVDDDAIADLVIDVTVADSHTLTIDDFSGVSPPAANQAFVPFAGKFGLLADVSAIDVFDKLHDTRFDAHSDFLGISPPNDFLL